METSFWQTRWARDEIGFHLPRPHPKLLSLWPALVPDHRCPVFVPLCGKSLDLVWLLARGHTVTGVEVSERAVRAFFAEQQIEPVVSQVDDFLLFQQDRLRIFCGDFFALSSSQLAGCTTLYDRAALIALPPELRRRYARQLQTLLPRAHSLLLTLLYPQAEMAGPPFSVDNAELIELFPAAQIACLLDHDILAHEPRFSAKGVSRLHEQAWSLRW